MGKKTKEVIGIAGSDFHLHQWPNFNKDDSRLKWAIKGLEIILQACREYDVPLFFPGDLFHDPKSLTNPVLNAWDKLYRECIHLWGIKWFAIPGNHDMSEYNTLENEAPNYFKAMQSRDMIIDVSGSNYAETQGFTVHGVAYHNFQKEWLKAIEAKTKKAKKIPGKKILLLHGDAPGAKLPGGRTIKGNKLALPTRLDDYFKDWDLVLFGHIHLPQQLSDKCYMIGSHMHQITSDAGTKMGYWKIFSDLSMEFVPINHLVPEFVKITSEMLPHFEAYGKDQMFDEKGFEDYFIYETDDIEEDEKTEKVSFHVKKSRKHLSKAYCKEKNITDKKKIKALTSILESV